VHLGAFLLLKISPLFELSIWLRVAVISVGVLTAIYAALAARVQTDIKCALSFASLTQVGIIFVEIGLGLQYLALIHILGHGCWRTLQFLRAPSLLHDFRLMENAVGDRLEHADTIWQRFTPAWLRQWLYRFALERGYFDSFLTDYVVGTFRQVFSMFDRWERAWTDFLTGGKSRESEQRREQTLDDLL
jgi:NAD(P)H-quinone oxidoreductase subunit 5